MKKILLAAVFAMVASLGYVCAQGKYASIHGTVDDKRIEDIRLYETVYGEMKEVATSKVNDAGEFRFGFVLDGNGVYIIETKYTVPTFGHAHKFTFYFKPEDVLNVEVGFNDYTLTGDNTPENIALYEWYKFMSPLKNNTATDREELDARIVAAQDFKPAKTGNKEFDKVFSMLRRFDMPHFAFGNASNIKEIDYFLDKYDIFSYENLATNAELLEYPYGMHILSLIKIANTPRKDGIEKIRTYLTDYGFTRTESELSRIQDDTIRGEIVLHNAQPHKTYDGRIEYGSRFGKYLATEQQKKKFKDLIDEVSEAVEGKSIFDINMRDINDQRITLSSFKGKVVYVDVWATWCGPCVAQIPALKVLEKEYHEKDIVFVSVSVDNENSRQVWKKFVEDNGLGGIQLFAGDEQGSILKPYKITGIPRFIVIGRDCTLVSIDAPRPSSGDTIRSILDATLAK